MRPQCGPAGVAPSLAVGTSFSSAVESGRLRPGQALAVGPVRPTLDARSLEFRLLEREPHEELLDQRSFSDSAVRWQSRCTGGSPPTRPRCALPASASRRSSRTSRWTFTRSRRRCGRSTGSCGLVGPVAVNGSAVVRTAGANSSARVRVAVVPAGGWRPPLRVVEGRVSPAQLLKAVTLDDLLGVDLFGKQFRGFLAVRMPHL